MSVYLRQLTLSKAFRYKDSADILERSDLNFYFY